MSFTVEKVCTDLSHDRAIVGCVVKRSFRLELGRPPEPLDTAPRQIFQSEYLGDGADRELFADPDGWALGREGVDVVVRGSVHAPRNDARVVLAGITIGDVYKGLRAFGERTIELGPGGDPRFSEPAPFSALPLTYRAAFGGGAALLRPGRRRGEPERFTYPRNAIGVGLVLGDDPAALRGATVPNFEDPSDPVTPGRMWLRSEDAWPRAPIAAGLGPIDLFTFPRLAHVAPLPGVRPEELIEVQRGELSPEDLQRDLFDRRGLDPRSRSFASSGLRCLHLSGDEPLVLENLHPEATVLSARLPGQQVEVSFRPRKGPSHRKLAGLRTVELAPEEGRMTLTYAAASETACDQRREALGDLLVAVRFS